jgi:hypothetical protein
MKSGKITGHSKITGWGTRDILYLSIQISPKSPSFVTRPRKTGWLFNVKAVQAMLHHLIFSKTPCNRKCCSQTLSWWQLCQIVVQLTKLHNGTDFFQQMKALELIHPYDCLFCH